MTAGRPCSQAMQGGRGRQSKGGPRPAYTSRSWAAHTYTSPAAACIPPQTPAARLQGRPPSTHWVAGSPPPNHAGKARAWAPPAQDLTAAPTSVRTLSDATLGSQPASQPAAPGSAPPHATHMRPGAYHAHAQHRTTSAYCQRTCSLSSETLRPLAVTSSTMLDCTRYTCSTHAVHIACHHSTVHAGRLHRAHRMRYIQAMHTHTVDCQPPTANHQPHLECGADVVPRLDLAGLHANHQPPTTKHHRVHGWVERVRSGEQGGRGTHMLVGHACGSVLVWRGGRGVMWCCVVRGGKEGGGNEGGDIYCQGQHPPTRE